MLTPTNSTAGLFPSAFWELGQPAVQRGAVDGHWLVLSFIPETADPIRVGIDVFTMRVSASPGNPQRLKELHTAMEAIMPLVMEYRAAMLDLAALAKSPADARALSNLRYRCTWLEWRCKHAFDALHGIPLKDMAKTALAFKPSCSQSYFEALSETGYALKLFPEDELTGPICAKAVATDPGSLSLVPGYLRSRELCLLAASSRAPGAQVLQYVPVAMRDQEMIDAALRSDGGNLQHVPTELKTVERCALACVQNGLAWEFVPSELRVPEVEFGVAMHGINSRNTGGVYTALREAVGADQANSVCDKWEKVYRDLHYPNASNDELHDLGLAPQQQA